MRTPFKQPDYNYGLLYQRWNIPLLQVCSLNWPGCRQAKLTLGSMLDWPVLTVISQLKYCVRIWLSS